MHKRFTLYIILLLICPLILSGCLGIFGVNGFAITVEVNNQNMGSVIGIKKSYEKNATTNLTAQAKGGFTFVKWSGDVPEEYIRSNPLKLVVTKDLKIMAHFEPTGELAPILKPFNEHNPLLAHKFGADPYALVYEDRIYVYSTNDVFDLDRNGELKENNYGQINTINRISSDDMVNWTDHGSINIGPYGSGKARWAGNSWAPAAIYKNINGRDQFFLYFANSANGIGVLTADSPVGPFRDPISKPLVSRDTPNANVVWLFDPAVVMDGDGKGYLYFGGGVPEGKAEMPNTGRVVELGDDMISLVGVPKVVDAPWFFEAAFVHRLNNTFYYSYCTNWDRPQGAADIVYMSSDDPMGPWEYQGTILQNPGRYFPASWGNNHHSMAEFQGKWYIFYHARLLEYAMGIDKGYRSTHVDEVIISPDGSIRQVTPSKSGARQIKYLNPYQLQEAETMAWSGGISVIDTKEPSDIFGQINTVVAEMTTGSFVGVSGVDFGQNGAKKITAKVSSPGQNGEIRVVLDDPKNAPIGYLEIPSTGSLENFVTVTTDVSKTTGVHDLFFVFVGEGYHFDAWQFSQ